MEAQATDERARLAAKREADTIDLVAPLLKRLAA